MWASRGPSLARDDPERASPRPFRRSALSRPLRRRLERARQDLAITSAHLARLSPERRIAAGNQRLALLQARAGSALRAGLEHARSRFELAARGLNAVSPLATLERGYAIVSVDGHVVTDASEVAAGAEIEARLARGTLKATVRG